jgi:type 1 fimbriae regulatory protein FimB/type 1 fimbriae regulatory protein FimE
MAKTDSKRTSSAIVKRTVTMPRRPKNADVRTREYLTDDEVQHLAEAAKANRHGHRDTTMILVAYRHGLRASELTDLRLGPSRVRFGHIACAPRETKHTEHASDPRRRIERSTSAAMRTGTQITVRVYVRARHAVHHGWLCSDDRTSRCRSRLGFKAHPHILRHACGYALTSKGHDTRALQAYVGYCNIQHTVRYTELSPALFKDFWRS